MDPLSDERFLAIINRYPDWEDAQVRADISAVVDEVIRLRGIIYDAGEIRVQLQNQVLRLAELLV